MPDAVVTGVLEIEAALETPDAGIPGALPGAPVTGILEMLEPLCSPVTVALDSGTRTMVDSMVAGLTDPV